MNGDPSNFHDQRATDSISKIKDLSSVKCYKEMKES